MVAKKKPNPVQDKPNPNARPRPAAARAQSGPTSASEWKKKTTLGTLVTVPSGNEVRVRTPGMQVFLTQGVIPNGLMPIIQDAMKAGEAPSDEAMNSMADDPEKLQEVLELADAVALFCFIEPKLERPPTEKIDGKEVIIPLGDERRDEEVLYVDEVDLNDKLFIFQFAVGGTAKLEQFRQE